MIGENIVRQAATRKGHQGSTFELYAWFLMRVSGAVLLFIVTFHLMYMHFLINGGVFGGGGVATIEHATIVGRWMDPAWGTAWRTFDLILLIFAFTHGTNGMRYIIEDYVHDNGQRTIIKTALYFVYFILMLMGAYIIISFNG